jgi:hypothetical protein
MLADFSVNIVDVYSIVADDCCSDWVYLLQARNVLLPFRNKC